MGSDLGSSPEILTASTWSGLLDTELRNSGDETEDRGGDPIGVPWSLLHLSFCQSFQHPLPRPIPFISWGVCYYGLSSIPDLKAFLKLCAWRAAGIQV